MFSIFGVSAKYLRIVWCETNPSHKALDVPIRAAIVARSRVVQIGLLVALIWLKDVLRFGFQGLDSCISHRAWITFSVK